MVSYQSLTYALNSSQGLLWVHKQLPDTLDNVDMVTAVFDRRRIQISSLEAMG